MDECGHGRGVGVDVDEGVSTRMSEELSRKTMYAV